MKNKLINQLLFVLLLITCLFLIIGCSPDTSDTSYDKTINEEIIVETIKKESESEAKGNETETETIYAYDKAVNNFIIEYNKISKSPLESIEKGNIRTKYFASSYGYWLEILHVNDIGKVNVSINVTNDTVKEGVIGMREVFHDIVKVIDSQLSDDEIYTYFDNLVKNKYMITDEIFSDMKITYIPDKELSGGNSRGRIDVKSLN